MRLFVLSTIIILVAIGNLTSQTTGQNESNLDWKIIETEKVDVIFTPEMKVKANRIANIINQMAVNNTKSIGEYSKRKIQLVIRNKTIIPNGYVGLSPHRSEFFATPPEDLNLLGSNDWLDALTIHEYRHVQQNYNERRGLANLFYYLQGQNGWAGLNAIAIPNWFSEGDAVIAETTMTKAGRGRTPNFMATSRAMALEGKDYTYSKWRNGSYDELMPDHYRLGYMMLTHMRNEKGSAVSAEVLAKGSKVFTPYPFSVAMKSKTGYNTRQLFNVTWEKFSTDWKEQQALLNLSETKRITKEIKTPTFYNYPQYDKQGNLIALKNSYKKTPHIITLEGSEESDLRDIGISMASYIHFGGDKITWTEASQNLRRNNTSFSDIMIYDLTTKKTKQLTESGKYFSPALSSDGQKVVTASVEDGIHSFLHVLNVNDGSVDWTQEIEAGAFAFNPSFTQDGSQIVYIKKKNSQLSLRLIDLKSKKEIALTPYSSHVISSPRVSGSDVYFSAAYSQIDNIYKVSLDGSQDITQITSVPIAAYQPAISPDGKQLVMTEVISNGNKITTLNLTDAINKKITIIEPIDQQWLDEGSAEYEGGPILGNDIIAEQYVANDYTGIFRGMRLHSWSIQPSNVEPSVGLQWNNVLDDVAITLAGGYNVNEEKEFYSANLKIAKYYPIFDLRIINRGRTSTYLTTVDTFAIQEFRETSFGGDVSVPLSTIDGNFFKNINIGVGADYRITQDRKISELELADKTVTTANAFLNYNYIRRKATQNIRSKAGFTFGVRYFRDLDDSGDEKFTSNTSAFLPGLLANHSLKLSGRFQRELLTNSFKQSDTFQYSRGYNAPLNDQAFVVSVDYAFPLLYPDFGIAGIMYFKRIRANIFYDYGQISSDAANISRTLSSAGSELIFDIQYFNLVEISLGLRYSQRLINLGSQKKGGDFGIFIAGNL